MASPEDVQLIFELSRIHDLFRTSSLKFIEEIPSFCEVRISNHSQITAR